MSATIVVGRSRDVAHAPWHMAVTRTGQDASTAASRATAQINAGGRSKVMSE
jgi:hypothetical protein